MLTREGCLARQERCYALLAELQLDGAVVSDPRDIYYLTGQPLPPAGEFPAVAVVAVEDGVTVLAHEGAEPLVAERVEHYPWHVGYTRNLDNCRALARLARSFLADRPPLRLGYQAESLPHGLVVELGFDLQPSEWLAIDDELLRLQRRKDPDELALMRRSIETVLAAYDAAQRTIKPGISELGVLGAAQTAAQLCAGEPIFHGGDYQADSLGGSARDRRCEAGELYIIDAWSVYRGYWSDLSRTYAVGLPSELQQSVFEHLKGVLEEVPSRLQPGLRGTELWAWMDARIREHPHLADVGLIHHAGHGTGLRAHTEPDLNRDREGILELGDTVSVEPGAYTPELRAGIRIENTFVITETGCELLSPYPLALVHEGA